MIIILLVNRSALKRHIRPHVLFFFFFTKLVLYKTQRERFEFKKMVLEIYLRPYK